MNKFLASRATSRLFSIKNKNQSAVASVISITRPYGGRSGATHQLLVRFIDGLHSQNARNNYYQRFQHFSTGTRVWFQLVIGEEALSSTSLSLNEDDFIDDLKIAVKKDYESRLAHFAKGDLTVYPPGTTLPVPDGADPCDPESTVVSHLKEGHFVLFTMTIILTFRSLFHSRIYFAVFFSIPRI
jgi:hypothetical protein